MLAKKVMYDMDFQAMLMSKKEGQQMGSNCSLWCCSCLKPTSHLIFGNLGIATKNHYDLTLSLTHTLSICYGKKFNVVIHMWS